jgi:hypothetical protein
MIPREVVESSVCKAQIRKNPLDDLPVLTEPLETPVPVDIEVVARVHRLATRRPVNGAAIYVRATLS